MIQKVVKTILGKKKRKNYLFIYFFLERKKEKLFNDTKR